jgi:hypothetical protein
MGQAVEITCPTCKKIFVVNPHMLGREWIFIALSATNIFPKKIVQKSANNRGHRPR